MASSDGNGYQVGAWQPDEPDEKNYLLDNTPFFA